MRTIGDMWMVSWTIKTSGPEMMTSETVIFPMIAYQDMDRLSKIFVTRRPLRMAKGEGEGLIDGRDSSSDGSD